ncbi:histidine phosphatase family protein [Vibrio hippocampi]|uniref:Phosphoserine phosphatase 2 n=1 Tax=Vibrio hippocampi TaxID=654686 RepID=A0ABN8DI55_9VIBR|nr:histidine phosphatase family protein [Vibrio hippocampi]CAH0526119.1 Putative phosphoserine phosphatase 2 [Vibrio hippocampi]
MNNFILVRHAKVNAQAGLFGQTDIDVLPHEQQSLLSNLVESSVKFERVISSPLVRCAELATLIEQRYQVPIEFDENIQEMNFGDYDGLTFDQMSAEQWQLMEQFWRHPAKVTLPNGESLAQFQARVVHAWQQIQQRQGNSLILAHGGVIRIIIAHILGLDWQQPQLYANLHIDNGSATHIQIHPQALQFARLKAIGTSLKGILL